DRQGYRQVLRDQLPDLVRQAHGGERDAPGRHVQPGRVQPGADRADGIAIVEQCLAHAHQYDVADLARLEALVPGDREQLRYDLSPAEVAAETHGAGSTE